MRKIAGTAVLFFMLFEQLAAQSQDNRDRVVDLGEFVIEAKVDKPQIELIPKRISHVPQLTLELDLSYHHKLVEIPVAFIYLPDDMFEPVREFPKIPAYPPADSVHLISKTPQNKPDHKNKSE